MCENKVWTEFVKLNGVHAGWVVSMLDCQLRGWGFKSPPRQLLCQEQLLCSIGTHNQLGYDGYTDVPVQGAGVGYHNGDTGEGIKVKDIPKTSLIKTYVFFHPHPIYFLNVRSLRGWSPCEAKFRAVEQCWILLINTMSFRKTQF